MQNKELEKNIDFLLSAALCKCHNLDEAKDLTQETILSVLKSLKGGKTISDTRGWLLTVMNRRYYDSLRSKYRKGTVTIGEGFEIEDKTDFFEDIFIAEEAEAVRREVAFLSSLYRSIIVRHYFNSESIEKIASDMNIPQGTVKSRLAYARNEMKKGITQMDNYVKNSFVPEKLYVRNSGRTGIDDEPMSLVPDEDVLAQNLLILAYEKPITITELAKAIGVPTAYIEPVIKRLVTGQLMKQTGDNKIYTDFVIYDPEDHIKYIKEQEKFAEENAEIYCVPMIKAIESLKETDFYSERLERYMIIKIAQMLVWDSLQPHIKPQVFPERPNGGAWMAFGNRCPQNYNIPKEKLGKHMYGMSGERWSTLDEYLGSRDLILLNFETSLYKCWKYDGFGYNSYNEMEFDITKLFYLIKKGIDPASVGFTTKMLKNMPLMEERGMLKTENGKPVLLIPCLTHSQHTLFLNICRKAINDALPEMTEKMGEYIKDKKKKLPPHLSSVPEQKRTMPYEPGAMVLVYEAINKGVHKFDLGYPCPEMVAVFD